MGNDYSKKIVNKTKRGPLSKLMTEEEKQKAGIYLVHG